MSDLIKGRDFADLFPAWDFYFLGFLLFLLFLFLLSLLLLELDAQVGQLQLDHIIHHLLDLVLYFGQDCLFDLFDFWLVFGAGLVLPFFGVLLYVFLHDEHGLSGSASRILLLELVLLCQFLLLFALALLFFLGFGQLQHHLLLFWSRGNLHLILLIEVFDSIWYFAELCALHELADPQPAVSQHLFFEWLFPFLV